MSEKENSNYDIKESTDNASSRAEFYIEAKTQMIRHIQELQKMYDKTLQMKFSACTTRMDLLLMTQNIERVKLALNKFEEMDDKSSPVKNENLSKKNVESKNTS